MYDQTSIKGALPPPGFRSLSYCVARGSENMFVSGTTTVLLNIELISVVLYPPSVSTMPDSEYSRTPLWLGQDQRETGGPFTFTRHPRMQTLSH